MPARESKPPLPELSDGQLRLHFADQLPSFRDVPSSEKQSLFVRKLHLCSFTFDFSDQAKDVREKEMKRQTLLELVEYVNTGTGKFTESVAEDVVLMLSNNLFRSLPPTKSGEHDSLDPDEEEPTLEPAWPHLQVRPQTCQHGWCIMHDQPDAITLHLHHASLCRYNCHLSLQTRAGLVTVWPTQSLSYNWQLTSHGKPYLNVYMHARLHELPWLFSLSSSRANLLPT